VKKSFIRVFEFEGSLHGKTDGFPRKIDEYHTPADVIEVFQAGAPVVGEYTLVAQTFHPGSVYTPSRYKAYYAPTAKLAEAKRELEGKRFVMPAILDGDRVILEFIYQPPYTAVLDVYGDGYVQDNLHEDGYLYARVKNFRVVSEWQEIYKNHFTE